MGAWTNIKAIMKRELGGYFTSPVAYVFLVIFLLLTGFFTFTVGNFFERGDASLVSFFTWHPWLYLFLVPAAGMRLKVAGHPFSLSGDPDRERVATAADTEIVLAVARGRIRDLHRFRVLETKTCFYDVSSDERFIAKTVERMVMLTGFSGHGFKFGAVIGEKVAAAVAGEMSPQALATWISGGKAAS